MYTQCTCIIIWSGYRCCWRAALDKEHPSYLMEHINVLCDTHLSIPMQRQILMRACTHVLAWCNIELVNYSCCMTLSSLQVVSLDADIPLAQALQMACHLVHWQKAMTIYPLSESNVYITSPTADCRM